MKHYSAYITVGLTLTLILMVLLLPITNYIIGMTFFGKVPRLYNVTLAQFFFTQASYPLLGKPYPYAHYQLARTYFIQGELQGAIQEANHELTLHPELSKSYYLLALTYGYNRQEDLAIKTFTTYIEKNPGTWAARNDKAWLQFRIGDIDGAIATLTPVIDTNKGNAWVQNSYGVMLMNKERYSEAKVALTYAKTASDHMTEKDWGHAYPGNDPRVYAEGLSAMKASITSNLALVEEKLQLCTKQSTCKK